MGMLVHMAEFLRVALLVGMRVRVLIFRGVRVLMGVLVGMLVVVFGLVERVIGASVDEDVNLGGGDSASLNLAGDQGGVERESGSDGLQLFERHSGIDGRAEKHVAADPGKTI